MMSLGIEGDQVASHVSVLATAQLPAAKLCAMFVSQATVLAGGGLILSPARWRGTISSQTGGLDDFFPVVFVCCLYWLACWLACLFVCLFIRLCTRLPVYPLDLWLLLFFVTLVCLLVGVVLEMIAGRCSTQHHHNYPRL